LKDIPFGRITPFIGFEWDIKEKTVTLQGRKKEKYQRAIKEWRQQETHTLDEVQRLYAVTAHVPDSPRKTGIPYQIGEDAWSLSQHPAQLRHLHVLPTMI